MMKHIFVLLLTGCVLNLAGAEKETPRTATGNLFQAAEAGEALPEGVAVGNLEDQKRYEAIRLQKEGRAAAIAFLQAKGTEKMLAFSFRRLIEEQCKSYPELEPYRSVLETFYQEILGFEALKEEIADLYLKQFSIDELKQLTVFYQSDLGKKYAEAEVALSPELTLLFLKRQQEKMPELEKRLQNAAK